jgi:hypothetical protein
VVLGKGVLVGYLAQETIATGHETALSFLRQATGIGVLEIEMTVLEPGIDQPAILERYEALRERFERLGGYAFLDRAKGILDGLAAGLTLDQIREVTVRIVQAAGAMGIPMHQIRTEVGQILTGTIDQNALVGRNLGLTNALVENWKRQGTLASELLKRTAAFEEAGKRTASSWSGVTSSLQEATQVIAGAVTKPLFDAMESGLNRALSGVFDITSGTISTRLAGLVSGFQGLFSSIGSGASAVIGGAVSILQDLSAWLERNRERFGALVSAIGSGASAAASAIGNLVGVFLRLLDAAIEPLTVVLNALAVVLDSVVGQVAIFARILIGPLVSAGTAAIISQEIPHIATDIVRVHMVWVGIQELRKLALSARIILQLAH